jgi:large subunit ribosomal protein L21
MFAVIKTGGKQYKVAKDDVIRVEKLEADQGASIELRDVMMVGNGADVTVGTPVVEGAVVTAEVVEQTRGAKIIVFKKKRRKDYQRTKGHRQNLTVLRVTDISPDGKKAAAKPKAKAKAAKKPAESETSAAGSDA